MDQDPRHPGTDPDPGKLNGYLRFRIRNTAQWFAKMSSVLPRLVARPRLLCRGSGHKNMVGLTQDKDPGPMQTYSNLK
jgi:hypothetical protein